MRDNEFSHPGAEYNQVGQEFESAAREWNLPAAEVDRSGREYRQESAPLAVRKRKKRRINPAMATVAAVATAAVVISPINRVIRSYPTHTPSAASRAYLDYAVETVKEGDWDALLAAATDSRLDDVIREDFAPYAMKLALEYDYEHAAFGVEEDDDDCRNWTSLEQFVNAAHFNVVYDGSVLTRSGRGEQAGELRCSKWSYPDETGVSWHVDQEWIEEVNMQEQVQYASAYTHVHSEEGTDRRSINMDWAGGTFQYVEILNKPNHYTLMQVDGIRKNIDWSDSGAGTAKDNYWEVISEGDFSCEWVEYEDHVHGGHHEDYLENGTVTYRWQTTGQEEIRQVVNVRNGSVVLESGKLSVEQNPDTNEYQLVLWYYSETEQDVTQRTIAVDEAQSEEDFLYHLF